MIKTGLGARGREKKINTVAETGLKKEEKKGGGLEVRGGWGLKKRDVIGDK